MYGYDLSLFVKRVSVGFTTPFCPAPGAPYQTRNASPLAAVLEHLGQAYAAAAHSIVMLPFDRSFGSRSIFARPRPARFAFLDHERMIGVCVVGSRVQTSPQRCTPGAQPWPGWVQSRRHPTAVLAQAIPLPEHPPRHPSHHHKRPQTRGSMGWCPMCY